MPFRLAQVGKVKWPVDVQIPQDGGKVQKVRFTAELEILSNEEYETVLAEGDVLARVLTGWEGVQTEEGEVIEFSEEERKKLCAIPYVRLALMQAYVQASAGREAARKN